MSNDPTEIILIWWFGVQKHKNAPFSDAWKKQNDNTIFRFAGVQFSTKNRATVRIVNMLMPVSNEINCVEFLKGELVVWNNSLFAMTM